jgi:hypothetical protein
MEEEVGVDVVLSLWVMTYLFFVISNYGTFRSFPKRLSTRPLNLLFQFPQMLGINQIAWEDAYN